MPQPNPTGMMIPPEFMQQMSQQSMGQSTGGQSNGGQPCPPQGMQMMGISQEMLNSMPPQQKQMIMQQIQQQGAGKMGMMSLGGFGAPGKKEDDKK